MINKDLGKAMLNVNKPIIGAINGYAITGGFELALMCVHDRQRRRQFADIFWWRSSAGAVPTTARLIGINRAKELSLTSNFLDAQTAYAWGLVNRVVPASELINTAEQLASDIVSTEPVTRNTVREIIDSGWRTSLAEGLKIEHDANREHAKTQSAQKKSRARTDTATDALRTTE